MPSAPTSRLIASDGLQLAAEVCGSGPPLLYAHSLGACRHYARRLLEPLAADHRIILFDQRGHCGSTPVTDAALYTPQRMANDLAAVLDAFGIDAAILVGESMGAATTLLSDYFKDRAIELAWTLVTKELGLD